MSTANTILSQVRLANRKCILGINDFPDFIREKPGTKTLKMSSLFYRKNKIKTQKTAISQVPLLIVNEALSFQQNLRNKNLVQGGTHSFILTSWVRKEVQEN